MANRGDATVDMLETIPVFQGLTRDELGLIVPLLEQVSYTPDKRVIKEGAYGNSMYIIIRGTVKVTKSESSSEEVFLQLLYAGSYFGEFSLIDNMPRSATITTIDDTEMFILKKEAFDALLAKHIRIANIFYRNCIVETFSRIRNAISNLTFSQHILHEKTSILNEINKDLSLAKKVQNYFLNTESLNREQEDEDIRHSYIYQPCSEIGGDFINIARIDDDHVGIIIADVMGHGITAALATGVLKSAFTIAVPQLGTRPLKLLNFLNKHILRVISELYATCYYALIDTGRREITFSKAGHHHPLFWKADRGDLVEIQCIGNALGLMKMAKFGSVTMPYEAGDKLLFFTDGIIEQNNGAGEMYSEGRLRTTFIDTVLSGSSEIVDAIFDDFRSFVGDIPFDDDITMLLLEF
ncbi:MAG: SpoIIE family protein phosphatase [Spirochaetes bacterium]|nr:SpoIIE family protein phosphatase [Spirochaetota bacterium]